MKQKTQELLKNKNFWIACAGLAVLVSLVLILIFVRSTQLPAGTEESTGGSTGQAADTTADTGESTTQTTSALPPNLYGPNDFQFDGEYLTCLAGESVLGIDVSRYQNEIDWSAVRDAGVEFAIIRVGGRGYGSEGALYDDDNALSNYLGAKEAGLQVGVYFFSQATNVEEAREEANFVLDRVADWELDFPVVYDWEYISDTARTANVDARTLTDCTLAFCEAVEQAGFEAMVYFNPSQASDRLYLEELLAYDFWLALHDYRMTFPYRIDMWQYTMEGTVPGIEVPVDINLYFPQ